VISFTGQNTIQFIVITITELQQLVTTGIIQQSDTGWFIPKFKQRQDAMPAVERMQKSRESKQHDQYNGTVTNLLRNVTQITDNRIQITDTNTNTEATPINSNFIVYQQEIGEVTPYIADAIEDAEKMYPAEWIPNAIRRAATANVRKMSYVTGILKNWKLKGFTDNSGTAINAEPEYYIDFLPDGTQIQRERAVANV